MTSAVQGGPGPAGWTAEVRRTLVLAVPMAAAYLAELGMWWTDQAVLGRIGSNELAAVGLGGGLQFELLWVGMGVLSIVAVMVGNAHGAGTTEPAARAVRQGLRIGALLSIGAMVYGWYIGDLLALAGQAPVVVDLTHVYTRVFLIGVPAVIGFGVLRSFVTGVSRPAVVTAIVVAALPVNLELNLLLVFGGWGVPALGVAGSALASALANWLMLGALVAIVVRSGTLRSYRVFAQPLRHDREEWRMIWRLGLPISALTLVENGFFVAISLMAGLFGTVTLAANQIASNMVAISAMIAVGIGEAAAVRVAQERGNANPAGARLAGLVAVGLGCTVASCFAVLMWSRADLAAALFIDAGDPANAATVELAVRLCWIVAVLLVFDSLQIVATRALRGVHDTTVPAWISALGYWVLGVPLAALLGFVAGLRGPGLWWGLAVGLALASVVLARRFLRLTRPRSV